MLNFPRKRGKIQNLMKKIRRLKKKSYIKFIENSVGSKSWRNFYAVVGGEKADVLKSGNLSCAFFASSVLLIFGLSGKISFTVKGAISDLEKNGWEEIGRLKPGAVLIWEKNKMFNNEHIGFCLNKKTAISNYYKKRMPAKHHITYGTKNGRPVRRIIKIFWHKELDQFMI